LGPGIGPVRQVDGALPMVTAALILGVGALLSVRALAQM